MKTLPPSESNSELVHTPARSLSKPKATTNKTASDATEVLSFTNIKNPPNIDVCSDGPIKDLDCNLNFSFEKNRLRAMENSDFFVSVNTSSVGVNIQAQILKVAEQGLKEVSENYHTIDLALHWTRNVAIVSSLVLVLEVVGAFFGILMATTLSVSIEEYVVFLSLEAVSSMVLLYLSIRVTGLNRTTIRHSQRTFKFSLILLIALIVIFIVNSHYNSPGGLISCAGGEEVGKNERTVCIILACCFFFSIGKITLTTGYTCVWVVTQFILKRIDKRQSEVKMNSLEMAHNNAN